MNVQQEYLIERLAALCPAANRLPRSELAEVARAVQVLAVERPNPDQLWTIYRVASYLGVDLLLAERLLNQTGAPQPLPDSDVWRARDIYTWLDEHGRNALKNTGAH